MIKKLLKAAPAALLCVIMCLQPPAVSAAQGGSLSLSVRYADAGVPISGAAFSLYRAADISGGEYTLAGAFSGASVDMGAIGDTSAWAALAETLSAYAAANQTAPSGAGVTDEYGRLSFSALRAGVYLLAGGCTTLGGYVYTAVPALLVLPDSDTKAFTADVKFEKEKSGGSVDLAVNKIWAGYTAGSRPESVTILLLKDGALYDSVSLGGENGWAHTWEALPNGFLWQLTEENVPAGCTVLISRSGSQYTVTNTLAGAENTSASGITGGGNSTLPQTGQLNWPVPALAGAGLALVCLGGFLLSGRVRGKGDGQ